MTLDEFISKYNGKYIDFDKTYGAQCFDLYRQYCQEVLVVPQSPPTGDQGAKRIWDTYLQEYFEKISNSPDNSPQKGDIVIWGDAYGPYGHVAVCTEATVNTFKCFSQNDPSGVACGIKWYKNYSGVLGWLRKKSTDYRGYDLNNTESMKICVDDHIKVVEGQFVDKTLYESIKGQLTKSEERVESLSSQLGTANSTIASQLKKIESQTAIIEKFNDEDAVQIRQLRESYEKETKANSLLWDTINEWADILKYKIGSDSASDTISGLTEALQSQLRAKVSPTQPKPIVIKPPYSVIIDIIKRILFGGK